MVSFLKFIVRSGKFLFVFIYKINLHTVESSNLVPSTGMVNGIYIYIYYIYPILITNNKPS